MSRGKKKKLNKEAAKLSCVNPDAAGIDIGSKEHWVAVPQNRDEQPVRCFGCFTSDLHELADWLKRCEIKTVAIESTGVYWIPLYQILESRGFEVKLVNTYHVKTVPGRKSDIQDCQWLQQLHSYGLLGGSFHPDNDIAVLRRYMRHRDTLVQGASQQILRMQKAMDQMNLHLHKVISDITGVTGMAIIQAILRGERDPLTLARMKHPQIKNSEDVIAKALEGDYREELIFCLRQAFQLYEYYQKQMADCDHEIEKYMRRFIPKVNLEDKPLPKRKSRDKRFRSDNAPAFNLREELYKMTGVDLTEIDGINVVSAWTFISELGTDMSKFPTEKHLVSYLGLCPNKRITGGRVISSRTRKIPNRVSIILRVCAQSLSRSKSYLGAYYRRLKSRLGAPKAITATARKLACAMYRMLKYGENYRDLGQDFYEKKYKQRMVKNLKKRAQMLGFQLQSIQ
jgi:transposase